MKYFHGKIKPRKHLGNLQLHPKKIYSLGQGIVYNVTPFGKDMYECRYKNHDGWKVPCSDLIHHFDNGDIEIIDQLFPDKQPLTPNQTFAPRQSVKSRYSKKTS